MSFSDGKSKNFDLRNILQVSNGYVSRPAIAPVKEK